MCAQISARYQLAQCNGVGGRLVVTGKRPSSAANPFARQRQQGGNRALILSFATVIGNGSDDECEDEYGEKSENDKALIVHRACSTLLSSSIRLTLRAQCCSSCSSCQKLLHANPT